MWLQDNHIKAVLFDVDGTLLDTGEGIMHSIRYTLEKFGLSIPSADDLRKYVGPSPYESLQKYAGLSGDDARIGANIFREFYKNEALYEAKIYDGILPLLERLIHNGYKLGVATNKREDYALDILQHFEITDYCDVIHGADYDYKLTKADIINRCCAELGVEKEYTLYVGDTEIDAQGAATAGINFCAVLWGYGFKKGDIQRDYPIFHVCDTPNALIL